jgi:hypothetical protein
MPAALLDEALSLIFRLRAPNAFVDPPTVLPDQVFLPVIRHWLVETQFLVHLEP